MIIDNSFVNAFSLLFIGFNLFEIVLNHHVTYKKELLAFNSLTLYGLLYKVSFLYALKRALKRAF